MASTFTPSPNTRHVKCSASPRQWTSRTGAPCPPPFVASKGRGTMRDGTLEKLQLRRGVPEVFEIVFHLADASAGEVFAALEDEEVRDLLPQTLRVPDGRPDVRHVVFGADHGKHPGYTDGTEIIEADSIFQEDGLRGGAAGDAGWVAFYRFDHRLAGLRRKVPVLQDTPGYQRRTLRVVGRLPHGVSLVEPDIVQERRNA